MFTGAEDDGSDGEMHLIKERRAEVLLDRRDPAAGPNVSAVGSFGGLVSVPREWPH